MKKFEDRAFRTASKDIIAEYPINIHEELAELDEEMEPIIDKTYQMLRASEAYNNYLD